MRHLHNRLWSLWEMLELNASAFYRAAIGINRISSIAGLGPEHSFDEQDRLGIVDILNGLTEHLRTLDAKITILSVGRLVFSMENTVMSYLQYKQHVDEISERLRDELSIRRIFVLSDKEASYFAPSEPLFGVDVQARFGRAAFEIDEAAKCLALGRPTACVFHLMRTMEIGIAAIARSLGIPDPIKPAERNWGVILKKIWNNGVEKKWPNVADRSTGDGAFFESLYASLDAVKNPWRNGTMHVEIKYTDDEAEHIFNAVSGFMKKLASRFDENGNPVSQSDVV